MKTFLSQKRNKIVTTLGLVVTALFLLWFFSFLNQPYVPKEFLETRVKGGGISEEIVKLAKESKINLAKISAFDESGNYTAALNLLLEEVGRNNEARQRALELSRELEVMARNLPKIKPERASKIGLEATIDASQIVQRLINYNDYTYQLLGALRSRFDNGGGKETTAKIKEILKKMNDEAESVNDLNERYKKLMNEFDKLVS